MRFFRGLPSVTGDRLILGFAILASLVLHLSLSLIHVSASPHTDEVPAEILQIDLTMPAAAIPLSGGPLSVRQNTPPKRGPEPAITSVPEEREVPPSRQAQPETAESPPPTQPPEPVEQSTGEASASADVSMPVVASDALPSLASPELPRTEAPSGGVAGGTGLPGGGSSVIGASNGSSGSAGLSSSSSEKGFLPFYKVDRLPQTLKMAPLEYPSQARKKNLEATVVLEADIDEKGRVHEVRVVKPAGFGFDEAAKRFITESTFSPAYVGPNPVGVLMRFSISFSLQK